MKGFILILLLLLLSFTSMAQQADTANTTGSRYFVGVGASTIGYNLEYKHEPKGGDSRPIATVYVGYKLNRRASVQIGFSYAGNRSNNEYIYVEAQDKLIYHSEISHTRAVAIPVTFKYGIFYPFRRLQFYGTAFITPIISTTSLKKTERRDDVTTLTYNAKASGFNAYLTAGLGLNYSISKRLDGYGEIHLLNRSFNRGLAKKDEYPYPGSLAIGLNYNF